MKRILSFLSEKRIWTLVVSIACFIYSFFVSYVFQVLLISGSFTFLYVTNWIWYSKKTWGLADFTWWNWLAKVGPVKFVLLTFFNLFGLLHLLLFLIMLSFLWEGYVPQEYFSSETLMDASLCFGYYAVIHTLFGQLDFGLPENTSGAKKRIFINSDIFKE